MMRPFWCAAAGDSFILATIDNYHEAEEPEGARRFPCIHGSERGT